jgi:hypothetical protein
MPKDYSPEEIESWNRLQDESVERMRGAHSPWVLDEHRKFLEAIERANPGLPKHSHRFTWENLHPESEEPVPDSEETGSGATGPEPAGITVKVGAERKTC